jgi:hypothetical protein
MGFMARVEPGNNYKEKMVEAYPNYDLKLHYRAGR